MTKNDSDNIALAEGLCDLAERAGTAILAIYDSDFEVRGKSDSSPVTDADEKAEHLILAGLADLAPGVPVVAEESVAAGRLPDISGGRFFLVDPLDGTKEFISRNGEFTVNIALIEGNRPTAGVVHLPALGETFWTAGDGLAWRRRSGSAPERIACRAAAAQRIDGSKYCPEQHQRDERTDQLIKDIPDGIREGQHLYADIEPDNDKCQLERFFYGIKEQVVEVSFGSTGEGSQRGDHKTVKQSPNPHEHQDNEERGDDFSHADSEHAGLPHRGEFFSESLK